MTVKHYIKRAYIIWLKRKWLNLIAKKCKKFLKYRNKSNKIADSIAVLKAGYEITFNESLGSKSSSED